MLLNYDTITLPTIIAILIIAIIIIYYYSRNKRESFESLSKDDTKNAELILYFFKKGKKNPDFIDYINLLNKIQNTNLKIINQETFFELKTLNKLNKLNVDAIKKLM